TNALITRRGAPCGLITTRGFADALRIGNQNRPRLFELNIRRWPVLFEHVEEIDARMDASGSELVPPDDGQIDAALQRLRDAGCQSLAVCLLNAYRADAHELRVEERARRMGFEEISISSRVAPLVKLVSRGDTTVVDAYLNPILRRY